jgi:hypothetical protein
MDPSLKIALEFGVYDGGSIGIIRNSLDSTHQVFGFDTFTGLPEDWIGTDLKKGFFDRGGVVPQMYGVKFYKGLFSETIPSYLHDMNNEGAIGLLHIDCDLYSSTVDVLNSLNHLIVENTIIVFDEWIYNFDPKYNDHEQKAFYEWVESKNRRFQFLDKCLSLEIEQKALRIIS